MQQMMAIMTAFSPRLDLPSLPEATRARLLSAVAGTALDSLPKVGPRGDSV
jgi:hypothetical protein